MGTRADFYVGIGTNVPRGTPRNAVSALTERAFRDGVEKLLADPEILSTRPVQGWPWPWDDSRTTDYAYTFVDGEVRISVFGGAWRNLADHKTWDDLDSEDDPRIAEVPNMAHLRMGTDQLMAKSGLLIISVRR